MVFLREAEYKPNIVVEGVGAAEYKADILRVGGTG